MIQPIYLLFPLLHLAGPNAEVSVGDTVRPLTTPIMPTSFGLRNEASVYEASKLWADVQNANSKEGSEAAIEKRKKFLESSDIIPVTENQRLILLEVFRVEKSSLGISGLKSATDMDRKIGADFLYKVKSKNGPNAGLVFFLESVASLDAKVGDLVITAPTKTPVIATFELSNLARLYDLQYKGDKKNLDKLRREVEFFNIKKGTECILLEEEQGACRLSVLSGPHKKKRLWVLKPKGLLTLPDPYENWRPARKS